jgi:hypothetical protein
MERLGPADDPALGFGYLSSAGERLRTLGAQAVASPSAYRDLEADLLICSNLATLDWFCADPLRPSTELCKNEGVLARLEVDRDRAYHTAQRPRRPRNGGRYS